MSFWDEVGDVWNSVPTPGRWMQAVVDIAQTDEAPEDAIRRNLNTEPTERIIAKAASAPGIKEAVTAWAWTYENAVARPISTNAQVVRGARADGPGAMFHKEAWRTAWDRSDTVSPGQAVLAGWLLPGTKTEDLAGMGDKEDPRFNRAFSLASGSLDAALNWFGDPLVIGGKAAKIARSAATETKAGDLAALGAPDPTVLKGRKASVRSEFDRFVRDTDDYSASELIQTRAFKDAPELASLFAKATGDHEAKALVWRTAMGDTQALEALRAKRADVAAQYEALTADLDDLILPVGVSTADGQGLFDHLNDAPAQTAIRAQLDQLEPQLNFYDRALGGPQGSKAILDEDQIGVFGSQSGRNRIRRADERKVERYRSFTVQDGLGGVPTRVLHSPFERRPEGWVYLHDAGQTARTMDHMLRRVRGLTPEQRTEWMDDVVFAANDGERGLAVARAEERIFGHIGEQLGYTRPEIDFLLQKVQQERGSILSKKRGQAYAGRGEDIIRLEDGTAVDHRPLYETQLDNARPTLDVDTIYRVLKTNRERIGALRAGSEKAWFKTEEGLDTLNELWKFSVLFRGGYLLRNITDSQIRLISYLGGKEYARSQMENLGVRIGEKLPNGASWHARGFRQRIGELDEKLAVDRGFTPDEIAALREERALLGEVQEAFNEQRKRFGKGTFEHKGRELSDAFGRTNEEYLFHTKQMSSEETFLELARSSHSKLLSDMRGSGDWKTKMGDADGWEDDYLRVVNQQLRQSEIAMRLLKGESPESVAQFLRNEEGRALRRRLVHKGDTPEDLVEAGLQNIEHLIPDAGYRALLTERALDPADIRAMFPGEDLTLRPPVNADQTAWSLGQGKVASVWAETRDKYFKWANALPEDVLGRHPMYRHVYRGRLKQLIDQTDETATHITGEEIAVLEAQARRFARREMKRIMFDVSSKSNLGHFVRFVAPFYSAWEDTLTKYGRLVMRDPSTIPHAWQIWGGANQSEFWNVVDRDGNPIEGRGTFGGDEFIVMPTGLIPGADSFTSAKLSKKSMNLVLQGDPWWLPGMGPLVQVPVNEFVKTRPTLADAAKTILPYGTEESSLRLLLPGTVKNFLMPTKDAARIKVMIAQTETARWRQGLRADKPKPGEIEDRFDSYMRLRTFTSAVSPVSVQYNSPYQFYIDESHRYDEKFGLNADQKFYEKYGEDYYIFRTSLSKNVTGIRDSTRADKSANRVRDLIADHPQYGWFFVGPDNVGDFNRNVYVSQQIRKTGPLSDQSYRESYSPAEALARNNSELGWIQYQKLDAQISTEMERIGITDLRQKGGEKLTAVKRQWMDWARQQDWGRDWIADFQTRDDGRVGRFLAAANTAVGDERLSGRPDVVAMREYLTNRAKLQKVLQARKAAGGAITLTAKDNADLAGVWAAFIADLKDRYVQFGDVWSRELENDDMTAKVGG